MKLFNYGKDGGTESTVTGFWLIESKSLFSIALLRFSNGSRSSYHSHAFNSLSWLFKGRLIEFHHSWLLNERFSKKEFYRPSLKPITSHRSTFHKVYSEGVSWVFTIRGPWAKTWKEYNPVTNTYTTLTNRRKIVEYNY